MADAGGDGDLVAELLAAHKDTLVHAEMLSQARQRRREVAVKLYAAGHSYRWIGEQIGVSAQAVEGFMKYRQRNQRAGRR